MDRIHQGSTICDRNFAARGCERQVNYMAKSEFRTVTAVCARAKFTNGCRGRNVGWERADEKELLLINVPSG
jgi:hypothetical protein